jgi:hypothetical protein
MDGKGNRPAPAIVAEILCVAKIGAYSAIG